MKRMEEGSSVVLLRRKFAKAGRSGRGASAAPRRSRVEMKETMDVTAGSLPRGPILATTFSRGGTLVYKIGR